MDMKDDGNGWIRSSHFGTKGAYISLFIVVFTGAILWWTGAFQKKPDEARNEWEQADTDSTTLKYDTVTYEKD